MPTHQALAAPNQRPDRQALVSRVDLSPSMHELLEHFRMPSRVPIELGPSSVENLDRARTKVGEVLLSRLGRSSHCSYAGGLRAVCEQDRPNLGSHPLGVIHDWGCHDRTLAQRRRRTTVASTKTSAPRPSSRINVKSVVVLRFEPAPW
jgi:hypothetical protein